MEKRARDATSAAVIGLALIAIAPSSATAQQPPWPGCQRISKLEYDSAQGAKSDYNRFSLVRTRGLLRRFHWRCPPAIMVDDRYGGPIGF